MNYPWLKSTYSQFDQFLEKPPQALCIVGVPGLGQASLAEHFAQKILNIADPTQHPDFLTIMPEKGKSIGIDAIREIHEFCIIAPTKAHRKILYLPVADAMTLPAQQAFLKTLEEPVIPTTFILISSHINKLLPTLRSRCQMVAIPSVSFEQAQPWFDSQQFKITPEDYALTDGAPLFTQEPCFNERVAAYLAIKQAVSKQCIDPDMLKQITKADPLNVLSGFYYALMHMNQFDALEKCIALRKKYADNANLNWGMQLNAFILEVQSHAV